MTDEVAGNQNYQSGHMGLIFGEGFSFSGYERNGVFLNLEGKTYKDISGVSGADSILDGRAAVMADFDNDGDYDLFVTAIQDEAHLLYRNNLGQDSGSLRVTLKGTESGNDAFGAQVRLKTASGVQSMVVGAAGFLAQQDRRLLFGTGSRKSVEWMEVRWPSGAVQKWTDVPGTGSVQLTEGKEQFDVVSEKRFNLVDPLPDEAKDWKGLSFGRGESLPGIKLSPVSSELKLSDGELPEGQAYFLNLWATWCGPCRKEMPELEALKVEFEEKGIQLVGISVDEGGEASELEAFARGIGVTYPIVRMASTEFQKLFSGGQLLVPFSILVNKSGKVVDIFKGWNEANERRLKKLLARSD